MLPESLVQLAGEVTTLIDDWVTTALAAVLDGFHGISAVAESCDRPGGSSLAWW